MPPEVNIKVTADTSQAQRNLDNLGKKSLQELRASTNQLATHMSGFSKRVDSMAASLQQASPRALELARDYEKLIKDFEDGNISIDEAIKKIDGIQSELADLNGEINDNSNQNDQNSNSLAGISTAWTELNAMISVGKMVFQEVAAAARMAYDTIKEGAALELAEIKFDRLSNSIGTTADLLNKDLGRATQGLLSQSSQMQLAGDLMSLGLAKTHDEAVQLSAVTAQLGMDMNQLVLTLTNQTTARFDQMGLSVDGFKERVKALEMQGYSTDEAFKWAFIAQAQAQIDRVGGIADTTAGQLMKLEAAWQNVTDTGKKGIAGFFAPVVFSLSDAIDAQKLWTSALENGIIKQEEAFDLQTQVRQGLITEAEMLEYVAERYNAVTSEVSDADRILAQYGETTEYVSNATWDHYHALNQSISVEDLYAKKAEESARASNVAGKAIREASEAAETSSTPISNLALNYSSLSTSVGSATQKLQEQIAFIAAGGGVVNALIIASQQALDAGDIGLAQKIADEATVAATDVELELEKIDATEAAQQLADQLGIGFEEAQEMVKELEKSIFTMTSQKYLLEFNIQVNGSTNIPGTTAPSTTVTGGQKDQEFASGTGGWMTVPGPIGAPYPVTLHGGEPFNVLPAGQKPSESGANVTIIHNHNYYDGIALKMQNAKAQQENAEILNGVM